MIPKFQSQDLADHCIKLPNQLNCNTEFSEELSVFVNRTRRISGYESFSISSDVYNKRALILRIDTLLADSSCPESYELRVSEEEISIAASDREGVVWALVSLYWMIRRSKGLLQCGIYKDAPKLHWRGYLLDSCRHFFPVEVVKSMIEQCSLRKINRLHWHLSDDQGYRIESRRFPALNTNGSWWINPDGSRYGGFYTWEEITDIVSFARARGIEIVPEIDMPGHVTAIVSSYPELSCDEESIPVAAVGGIHQKILCVGKESTVTFAKDLIEEILPLFPYHYFHIGGDEAPKAEWKNCPECQDKIQELGLNNEEELQAWFTKEMTNFLEAKGKTAIGWNEILKSGKVNGNTIVQYWAEEGEDENYCEEAFSEDRKCIYSESGHLYLDSIPALLPLRKVYAVEPVMKGGTRIPDTNLLGMECPLWAEMIEDKKRLEQMAFPRIFAMVQKSWDPAVSYQSFTEDVREELRNLDEDGIAHFSLEEADVSGTAQLQEVTAHWKPLIDGVLAMGDAAKSYIPIFRRLLSSKLADQFLKDELDDYFESLGLPAV